MVGKTQRRTRREDNKVREILAVFVLAIGVCGPSLAQTAAEPRPIPVGTKWIVETVDQAGSKKTTLTVTGTSTFQGKPVYLATDGARTTIIDAATNNTIGVMTGDKLASTTVPTEGTLSWPLSVGKVWTASFDYTDYVQGASFSGVSSRVTVAGYEDVTVPAGTFKAFRIQSTPLQNESVSRTVWYAPVPGVIVKRLWEREGSRDYRGTNSRTVMELSEYPAAQR